MSAAALRLRALLLCALLACSLSAFAAAPAVAQDVDDGAWPVQLTDDAPDGPFAVPQTPVVPPANVTMLRTDGKAVPPRGAPARVRAIVAAANRIVGRPYKWGGGHAKLEDRGYDCSGTVGYALIRARLLGAPMTSGQFARWGAGGAGRWVTVYANRGHVYMEIAGLRLDTSTVADYAGNEGPRWRAAIGQRSGFKVRHPLGL